MLNLKVSELEDKLKNEITAHKGVELSLVERNTMNKELENRVRLLSAECDALKKSGAGSEVSRLCLFFFCFFTQSSIHQSRGFDFPMKKSMFFSFQITNKISLISRVSLKSCLLYTSPSPRDATLSRMPSSA